MGKTVSPEQLAAAIQAELTTYHKETTDRVNAAGNKAIKKLVKMTRATAPTGATGNFQGSIASEVKTVGNGMKMYKWGAKSPGSRFTHLLVHGHATKNGGRAAGNSFLQDALDVVLPEYEEAVKEAVQSD